MSHVETALVVFACVFGSALFGLYLRTKLPEHHLSDESISAVKLAVGLIATMAALVLGLLVSSAKNTFDTVSNEVVHSAASIIFLDRVLAKYGPETKGVRDLYKQRVGMTIQIIASAEPAQLAKLRGLEALRRAESLQLKLEALSPRSEVQRQLQASAIQIIGEVLNARQLAMLQASGSPPLPLLISLVLWLAIILCAFGLSAPANATVIVALFLGALSTSGAIFLILEMNTPLDGVITVSLEPLREALTMLGQ
ncbi:hypothetical protein QU481_09820 [Crenobacter sp. SG2303]|uniref:DUF4239 domain-containing protein n=1 Tax=Crenobacter oryzisoli TaxID=3056844 RepID=A0ABT7XN77_9NEIS|nr:hypothetical protein [Crenobacter sp. SG2303]MDN0075185.1 hypothetical protein [Crenobacter sp. SG2303]